MGSSSAAPSPAAILWSEIGRASPGDALWVSWVAQAANGDALYRSLVAADGGIAVAVELRPRSATNARRVHFGRCDLPPGGDARGIGALVGPLLAAADEAAARVLEAARR